MAYEVYERCYNDMNGLLSFALLNLIQRNYPYYAMQYKEHNADFLSIYLKMMYCAIKNAQINKLHFYSVRTIVRKR